MRCCPEIKLEGYKELRADKPEIAVSEDDVEQALDDLRERHATFNPIEGRALADGDFAQVSLDGTPKCWRRRSGKAGEGQPVHMDEVLVEIAGGTPCRNSPSTSAAPMPAMSALST